MKIRYKYPDGLFSLTRLIAIMFRIFMAMIIGLSLFYAITLIKTGYNNYITVIHKNVENSAAEINEAISNLDKQTDFLSRIAGDPSIWNSASPYEDMLLKNKLTGNLQSFLSANKGVDAAIITKRNDTAILETHKLPENLFIQLVDICNGQRAITPKSMNVFREDGLNISHFIFSKSIKNGNSNHTIGNIYTLVRIDSLIPEETGDEALLLSLHDANGHNIIYGKFNGVISLSEWESAVNQNAGHQTLKIRGTRYYLESIPLTQPGWYILCLQPMNLFLQSMKTAFVIAVLLLIASITLVIVGERVLIHNIRIPLSDMLADIARIREEGYQYRLRPGQTIEFREVTNNFNNLLDDLNMQTEVIMNQQKKLYESQLLQKESQMLSLQSQIKPHFLYNTLECVLSIARHYHISEIIKIVNGMILIYRYSTVGPQDGTVGSEFECAKMYADIINTRSKNRYQFEFHIEDRLMNYRMPKMILQPLIENAVNHGISKRTGNGKVIITGEEKEHLLLITVWDNGKGISSDRLCEIINSLNESSEPSQSIGLHNIATRLRAQYGPEYGIDIESQENAFTLVSVKFPKEESCS